MASLLKENDRILMEQLSGLVRDGLVVAEEGQPVIYSSEDIAGTTYQLRRTVTFKVSQHAIIQQLREENTALRERLEQITEAIGMPLRGTR